MKFTNEQISFMRADLECDMGYSRFIDLTQKRFEEEGRDFYEEFEEWKKNKDKK